MNHKISLLGCPYPTDVDGKLHVHSLVILILLLGNPFHLSKLSLSKSLQRRLRVTLRSRPRNPFLFEIQRFGGEEGLWRVGLHFRVFFSDNSCTVGKVLQNTERYLSEMWSILSTLNWSSLSLAVDADWSIREMNASFELISSKAI